MAEELETLLVQLESDDPNVIQEALDRLRKIKPNGALEIILPFLDDKDADVRSMAAFALGDIQDIRAISHLLRFLEQEQGREDRSNGFMALENYNDPAILEYLLKEIDKPKVSRLPRQHVAQQLRNFDADASVVALIKLLQEDEDWIVRAYAADGLLALNRGSLRSIWEEALKDIVPYIQQIARQAIAQIKNRTSPKKRLPELKVGRKKELRCRKH